MTLPLYMLNGPNLILLGVREPETYGTTTLPDIETMCQERAQALGYEIIFRQSNHEGELVDWIQEARDHGSGILINPAGYTTTSIAILDALIASELPVIEVHLTNIHRREEFRHHSFVSKAADAVVAGAGPQGYVFAVEHLAALTGTP